MNRIGHLSRSTRMFRLKSIYHPVMCRSLFTSRISRTADDTIANSTGGFSNEIYGHTATSAPPHATVVVCGGGIVGVAIAHRLAESGINDVVLLEQGSLSCGSTWHAAGLVGNMKSNLLTTRMAGEAIALYNQLEQDGHGLGVKQCGSVNVARTQDRMTYFQRLKDFSETIGTRIDLITPEEIQEKCPLLSIEGAVGGAWLPNDIACSPTDVCNTLAKLAKSKGVTILERCKLNEVLVEEGKVSGVNTSHGHIQCQYFVNCGGQWSRQVGKLSKPNVRIPLHPVEHFYVVTKPMNVDRMMPVIRDYDRHVYFREWSGGILSGGFEKKAKPVFHEKIPDKFEFQLLHEDWDQFQFLLEYILESMPSMQDAEIRQLLNGTESFTPDSKPIVGQSPEIGNYFVAAGMSSQGITYAPGVANLIAQWITQGFTDKDTWALDIQRFVSIHNNRKFLRDRVKETVCHAAMIDYPDHDHFVQSCRKLRTSPLYTRMKGAVYGQLLAFERQFYFPKSDHQFGLEDELHPPKLTFHKPEWFDSVKSEYWACREGVCLIDMSSYTKIELKSAGREVVDFLQYICANDVDQPLGTIVHTGILNHRGGYENDCSVVRMAENCYFMFAPTSQQTRAYAWLSAHLTPDHSVLLSDVTSMYTSLNVIGPKAEGLLSELTETNMSKQEFHTMTCKEINLGNASGIKAMRLTHTGEDGFMLYIPSEYALHVYDTLLEKGQDYGIQNAGFYALRALRIEKFFSYWGLDISPFTTPFEVGREFRVKFDKDFIGKEALLKHKEQGLRRRLVHFTVEDHNTDSDPWTWGGEPIYRNGEFVGFTTSSCFGYTLNRLVCLGLVNGYENGQSVTINTDWLLKNANYEIKVAGKLFPAKAHIYPPQFRSTSASGYAPTVRA